MKLENQLFSLQLDVDMVAFKIGLLIEDLEEKMDLENEQGKDSTKTVEMFAALTVLKNNIISYASKRLEELRKNE